MAHRRFCLTCARARRPLPQYGSLALLHGRYVFPVICAKREDVSALLSVELSPRANENDPSAGVL